MQRKVEVIVGFALVLLLCVSEATPFAIKIVQGYVPPPRTTTGLKDLVDGLMNATPAAYRVDTDGDGIYDRVEAVIGTDYNSTDSDFDMMNDFYEVQMDSDPLDPDTNSDGLSDYMEVSNVTSLDLDGDNSTNMWDYDNDDDGVNDGVDLSPFSRSTLNDRFHFDVTTNGKPTYIELQFRPRNPENLKLYAQIWDWPSDSEGVMKDLDSSSEDVKVVPQLNVTVNIRPNQLDVSEFGILVTDYGMHVPVYPVWENDEVVAFSALIFYNSSSPLTLSMDARLIWRVLGSTDEKAKALEASNGKYVSLGSDGRLAASANGISLLETFQWLEAGENKTVLKVHGGPYVTVTNDGSVIAFGSDIGAAQTFELVNVGNGTFCLKAYNGKYVSIAPDGTLIANSDTAGTLETFRVVDRGSLSDWTILVTYKEPFMLTGFTIGDSLGCDLGLFYSADKEQTIKANLLLTNDFLRNSTTQLRDMPSVLAGYGVSGVSNLIKSFSIQEEAFTEMSNTMLPNILDSLPPNQTYPVVICVEEQRTLAEMSEFSTGAYVLGSSYSISLSASVEPLITAKTVKTNFYETNGYKALAIEDVVRDIATWQLSEQARFCLSNFMLAWNAGEEVITRIGSEVTTLWEPPDWLGDTSSTLEIVLKGLDVLDQIGTGIRAYTWLRALKLKGWNTVSLARFLKTGTNTGGFMLWSKMVDKISDAQQSFAGIKGLSIIGDLADALGVVATLVDIGMTFLSAVVLASQVGGHLGQAWGASFGIVSIAYTLIYTGILMAIGEIPYVGPILVLALVLADLFGGFSDWLSDLFMDWFGPDDLSVVEPWLEEMGVPEITFDDKDANGFDVGDRVSITLSTKSKVNVTSGGEQQWAQYSWYRPFVGIAAPWGSRSNTSATGVPAAAEINTTSGTGWKAEEYETGAWIEPGIGMPNFPVTVNLNVDYKLYHIWEHFVFYVVYWEWCRHEDFKQGVSSSHLFTAYYDVLPENIDDFRTWRGVNALDHDYDGLADVNETLSNQYKYDSDADGLNDKFENVIGTNPSNYDSDADGLPDCFEVVFGTNATSRDTDGDRLPDYLELAGWVTQFNYTGDPAKSFTFRVISDPRLSDSEGDGVDDYLEYWSGLNPISRDTNGDGIADVADPHFVGTELTFIRTLNMTGSTGDFVDMDVDADGNLYVLRYPEFLGNYKWTDGVYKYAPNGTLIGSWEAYADWPLTTIAVDSKNGYVYVARPGSTVGRYSLNGTYLGNLGAVTYVTSMDVDADGYLYLAASDYYDAFIGVLKYASNGTLVGSFGGRGDSPDKFRNPGKLAVDDKNGFVYVTDESPSRVTKWTKSGQYLTTIPEQISYPTGLEVDTYGYVYVADLWEDSLRKFDSSGMLIATWGSTGHEDGNFTRPAQVVVDPEGFVYVADGRQNEGDYDNPYPHGRVQKFSQGAEENLPFDDPVPDRDGDGLDNVFEDAGWNATFTNSTGTFTLRVTSDRLVNDTDSDGLTDKLEFDLRLNPRSPDTDGDGVDDFAEYQWHHSLGMNPAHFDTDGDGLDDGAELAYGSDPTASDTDLDGLLDLQEFNLRTNANSTDTDKDGLSDYQEVQFGSDPTNPDTDGDLMFDAAELSQGTSPRGGDTDSDGLIDGHESILGTNATRGDSDGDNLPDGFEVDAWLNPLSNDTDDDGSSDSAEIQDGTNPWNSDSDFDGIPDGEDSDSNSTQVSHVVLAFDPDDTAKEFADNLARYTNVTIVSKEQLLANYRNSPYIVLVGRPDGNGTVGKFIRDILSDSGDALTGMMESEVKRFAVRYGLWNRTQTVVTLSTSCPYDHLRVLDILRSKTVTVLPNSAIIEFNKSLAVLYSEGGTLNHTEISSVSLQVNEIDVVKATDATLVAVLENDEKATVQISRYNTGTTPSVLSQANGLSGNEEEVGKYLNVTVSKNVQNASQSLLDIALIQFYYRDSELDRNGNGINGEPGDIDEDSLVLYYFDEISGRWTKLSRDLAWVMDFGVTTADIELYGARYGGYVWAVVSHLSLYGIAGVLLTSNHPPDVTDAYPSQDVLWPPNKKPVQITIEGVTDPDGDEVTITVTGITADEPITAKDAYGIGTDVAWLSADRIGAGSGRAYVITFVASDGRGGESAGSVTVYVPHDKGKR